MTGNDSERMRGLEYLKVSSEKKENLIRLTNVEGVRIREAARIFGMKYANARKICSNHSRTVINCENLNNTAGSPLKLTGETLLEIEIISEENSCYTLNDIK